VLVWDAGFDPAQYFERSALLYTVPHAVMPVGSMLTHLVVERVFGFEASARRRLFSRSFGWRGASGGVECASSRDNISRRRDRRLRWRLRR
jgi:hypothetical protein